MNKIKVLFLASNPSTTIHLKLDEEIRSITEKIRASEHRDLLELVSRWAVRPDDLLQSLNEQKPQIIHFSGHGNQSGEIILVDKNGVPKRVSTNAIKALFKTLKDNIRVVVLNACFSKTQAEAITEMIDCAIGMNAAIGDSAAITFAASFYRAIGFGRSVKEAFDQGITALLLEGISEENIPELLVRVDIDPSKIFLVDTTLTVDGEKDKTPALSSIDTQGRDFFLAIPKIEDIHFLRGETDNKCAVEFLLHNPLPQQILIRRAEVKYTDFNMNLHMDAPPTYTYELDIDIESYSEQDDTLRFTGSAKEPQESWGRPVSGFMSITGVDDDIELGFSFPLYLQVASKEEGLVRLIFSKPKLKSSSARRSKPLFEEDNNIQRVQFYIRQALQSWLNSDGNFEIVLYSQLEEPITGSVNDNTFLRALIGENLFEF